MRIVRYSAGQTRYGLLEDDGTIRPLRGLPFEKIEVSERAIHVSQVQLLAPVEVRNLIGVGLNYVKHAQEAKLPLPEVPMLFMKPADAVIGPEAPIVYPLEGKNVHYEGELAAVIGKTARRVSEAEALSYVFGYTCGNDVSERVIQSAEMKQGCLLVGKGFDTFNPLGPCVVTGLDPANLELETRLNGVVKQKTSTSDLVFSVAKLVSYLSQSMTLRAGDVIMTGTPFGVGPVEPGDVVEVEISGIGVLRNPVVAEA
jgi:2-keto-4-pentenoate hydratase/2-oxohepta-3-ene-1,7-dioic acid hydratase in catechol pathway